MSILGSDSEIKLISDSVSPPNMKLMNTSKKDKRKCKLQKYRYKNPLFEDAGDKDNALKN
jgi:hypothetical protein